MGSEATPVNMAHHSYFNLAGHNAGSAALYNHSIKTWATWYSGKFSKLFSKTALNLGLRLHVYTGTLLLTPS